MKFRRMRIENVGPVEEGEVGMEKITVFVGPNGAGKSIVLRLVHALRRLDAPRSLLRQMGRGGGKGIGGKGLSRLYGEAVLLHSALERGEVAARGRGACRLAVSRGSGAPGIDLDFGPPTEECYAYVDELCGAERTGRAESGSVYVPAGRAGIVQSFAEIAHLRLAFAQSALGTAVRGLGGAAGGRGQGAPKWEAAPPPTSLPPHVQQFHDLVVRTIVGRPGRQFNRSLSRVFGGTIGRRAAGGFGLRQPAYRGPQGPAVPIASAGAGVLAGAPLLAGLYYVGRGGALIVEEPEAHAEPSAQLALVDEMVSAALPKGAQIVMSTHSDYVVKKVLALVACGRLRHSDVGIHYFRAGGRARARIERVPVDPVGAADQELFREALDSLVEEFSV